METIENETSKTKTKLKVHQIIGYILLSPALLSIIAIVCRMVDIKINILYNVGGDAIWGYTVLGNGATSTPLPFYFGLMAIAGAYLIKPQQKQ
jgi:hypothetical protein